MSKLLREEQDKYNYLHKSKPEYGLGTRQLEWISKSQDEFPKILREWLDAQVQAVLDIGCGGGTITNFVSERGCLAVGVDISKEAIKKAQEIYPNINFLVMSAHDLDACLDDFYTCVLHLDGLEHVPEEWEDQAISEAIRVCHPNCLIFYEIACGDAWDDHIVNHAGHSNVHINIKSPDEWEEKFQTNPLIDIYYCKKEQGRILLILRKKTVDEE